MRALHARWSVALVCGALSRPQRAAEVQRENAPMDVVAPAGPAVDGIAVDGPGTRPQQAPRVRLGDGPLFDFGEGQHPPILTRGRVQSSSSSSSTTPSGLPPTMIVTPSALVCLMLWRDG